MEYGYTPKNLKTIRTQYGLTAKQVAEITHTANLDTVYRWESDVDSKRHADMPHYKWLGLLKYLNHKAQGSNAKVKLIDIGNPNIRRFVGGELADVLDLDYTKPLDELQKDVSISLQILEQKQSFWKNLTMFAFKDIRIAKGSNHLQIVEDGKPEGLGWLWVEDHSV